MNAILETNLYAPFGIVRQLGLQQELIKNSFQVVMMLHRIFLTSKYFRSYEDDRLMHTSGTYGKLLEVNVYLRDIPLEERIRQEYASKKLTHWTTARRIAMEMAEMEFIEADVAYLTFYFMLEEAKRVLYSRTEYRLANVMKMYRDSLVAKWNMENYGRPVMPYGILSEVVKLVSDVHITHLKLRMRTPGLSQNDAWDDDYVLRLLHEER
ncbi:hypothetical protein AAVH_12051 [Aphelenchoides avenae]|nr:hypothetical protein AAVH_12051 [Aphelenchus avenae]